MSALKIAHLFYFVKEIETLIDLLLNNVYTWGIGYISIYPGGSTMPEMKPLNWSPDPGVGYTVVRRSDGGMQFSFTDVSPATIKHWRNFSIQHLYDSDRLTRNLYDLRKLAEIPEEAIRVALEVNSDPSARNIRLAVVVANDKVRQAILKIADLTPAGGVETHIFTNVVEAEAWLSRPLEKLV